LLQLTALADAWRDVSRIWVTFDKSDARSLLRDERVVFAYGPTNRSLKNLTKNVVLACKILRQTRPRVIVTTGAGVAVPFAWVGRIGGARVIYVESLTRINGPSLSCRLIAPIAHRVYAQWPELAAAMPRAHYLGSVFTDPA
jgi:UDP-N-acetylglucosamine:LPS N-acetylglucosamine transferase